MRGIDLHVHTTASDSTCSPREAVRLAKELGLRAIAITDHDTALGCAEAAEEGQRLGLEVIPGIEISTRFDTAVHVLGYCIDPESPKLRPVLDWVVADRDRRNREMAELMAADGIPVTYEGMKERFGEVIGRPHFGRLLVDLGLARDVNDAFARFVEKGQRYYRPRNIMPVERAVETIAAAGGVPVLAHPFQYRKDDRELRVLIEHCMAHGLRGMECRYSGYGPEKTGYLERLAEEYGLLKTGGSDFHGDNKPQNHMGSGVDGELDVPCEWLQKLKAAAGQ